jgi:hypothetical protein
MGSRTHQSRLFLAAVVLPAVLLSLLTIRFVLQDEELREQRAATGRAIAAEQARRELTTRLEKIQFQEENRRIMGTGGGAANPPADRALVFVTPWDSNGMRLPWTGDPPLAPTLQFVSSRDAGELEEFQTGNLARAAMYYRKATSATKQAEEKCEGRLALARVLVKTKQVEEAGALYREMLTDCGHSADEVGMSFSLYAADRLVELKLDLPAAIAYLSQDTQSTHMRPLLQAYMIRTILQKAGPGKARQLEQTIDSRIKDIEQVLRLAADFPALRPKAEAAWIVYGERPWILTARPATAQLPPLLFAISASAIAPRGTSLVIGGAPAGYSLAPGFSGVSIELDAATADDTMALPLYIYGTVLALILGLTILCGYLLLSGVQRDLRMAEMRSHFVASVSHELKTPLTAIRMFAETIVLGRTKDERTRDEYIQTIVNESERLARLVDNVLDFSKIEQGKRIYRLQPGSLGDVVESAARAMQYPLAQQGFELRVTIDDRIPNLPLDEDAMEQAILNLLSNAMKYSGNARTIELHCARQNGSAVVAVEDHGIGLTLEDQSRIFDKFYRVRTPETELIAGTGLGLTLVKHIVQAHGGSIDVQSHAGSGSTFSIRIPSPPEASA